MKNILVSEETHAELKAMGKLGETFEDVIKKGIQWCKEMKKDD